MGNTHMGAWGRDTCPHFCPAIHSWSDFLLAKYNNVFLMTIRIGKGHTAISRQKGDHHSRYDGGRAKYKRRKTAGYRSKRPAI